MTEPTGELFAAAKSIRASRLAAEAVHATKNAEQAARQPLIDQKRTADKQESDERAHFFVKTMQENGIIPTTRVFETVSTVIGTTHELRDNAGREGREIPAYKHTVLDLGTGWTVRPYRPYRPDDLNLSPEQMALVIMPDAITREGKPSSSISKDFPIPDQGPASFVTHGLSEAPYAGEDGLMLLGTVIDELGIDLGAVE